MGALRSESGGCVNRSWQLTLCAGIALLGVGDLARAETWKHVETERTNSQSVTKSAQKHWLQVEAPPLTELPSIQWEDVTADHNRSLPEAVVWTLVEPSVTADIEKKIEEEAPINDASNAAVKINNQ